MTANEIRNMSIHHFSKATFLQEIAAQLADLNEGIRLLAPAPKPEAPEPYEPSEQDRNEDALTEDERRRREEALATLHEEAMARPTSDPEKLVRCTWCTKEMALPKHGQVAICDDCIPF